MSSDDIYRVNENGERVTWETCTCRGCALERAMRQQLAWIDEKYQPTPDQQRYYGPREIKAHVDRWLTARDAVVHHFTRVGWFGCEAIVVIRVWKGS